MGRAPCCEKNGVKKGPWTPEEDQKLIDYIHKNGYGNWRTLPKNAGLQRCGKSCRLRWANYLRPDIKRGRFSFEEEETIIQLHSVMGNKWSAIAARLPGRTDNEIKNYWNTHIRKRLMRMGIDPVTHNPRLDLFDLSSILNSSQMNLSRLLGMQPLINTELMRLATSHVISDNPEFSNQVQMQNQVQDSTLSSTFLGASQAQNQIMQYDDVEQFNRSFCGYGPLLSEYEYGSVQSGVGSGLNIQSNGSNYTFSYGSVLSNRSTHSSSPTQLNSNFYSINSSSINSEDERESYCSNMLKFEIPDIMDVNDYM